MTWLMSAWLGVLDVVRVKFDLSVLDSAPFLSMEKSLVPIANSLSADRIFQTLAQRSHVSTVYLFGYIKIYLFIYLYILCVCVYLYLYIHIHTYIGTLTAQLVGNNYVVIVDMWPTDLYPHTNHSKLENA